MIRHLVRLLGLLLAAFPAAARTNHTPAEVLHLMENAADWQLAHPSAHHPLSWINGAFYVGLMSLAEVSPEPRYAEAMRRVGREHNWSLGPHLYFADDHCVGRAYATLYLRDRDSAMIEPMRSAFDRILAKPKDDNLDFDRKKNPGRLDRWSWCDSLFMAPPAWLELARATGDKRYLDFAVSKWWVTSEYLFDREERLFFRDSSFFTRREPNGRKVFWSRGNGWVVSGLARMLDLLPKDHPSRPRFEEQFKVLAARILECRQPDGLWRASLLSPETFPQPESSGSAFFCHALAWGVNRGLLPREPYAAAALDTWSALAALVRPDGRLTRVQPVGSSPESFKPDHTEPYGVGALLLAGAEIHRLLQPVSTPAP